MISGLVTLLGNFLQAREQRHEAQLEMNSVSSDGNSCEAEQRLVGAGVFRPAYEDFAKDLSELWMELVSVQLPAGDDSIEQPKSLLTISPARLKELGMRLHSKHFRRLSNFWNSLRPCDKILLESMQSANYEMSMIAAIAWLMDEEWRAEDWL